MALSTSDKIGLHDLDPSLISFFEESAGGGGNLVQHREILVAETDKQTDFEIQLETFDANKDSILLQSGRTLLFPEADFTIEGKTIKLKEGVDVGRTIGIYIFKSMPYADDETYFNGALLENGSISMDKLGEDITAELEEIKKSGSDGKSLVAGAITDKGIETAADATFEQMAANIGSIVTLDSAPGLEAAEITPGTEDQVISGGNYLRGDQTIKGDADLVSANIAVGKNIFGVDGSYTSDGTVTAAKMLKDEIGYANGVRVVGSIESQAAQTITPGTSNKTIAAGKYLEGTQTIKGDANLVAANIAKGKSIFGVTGTYDPASSYAFASETFSYKYNTTGTSKTYSGPILFIAMYSSGSVDSSGSVYLRFVPGYGYVYCNSSSISYQTVSSDKMSITWTWNAAHKFTVSSDFKTLTVACTNSSITSSTTCSIKVYHL